MLVISFQGIATIKNVGALRIESAIDDLLIKFGFKTTRFLNRYPVGIFDLNSG